MGSKYRVGIIGCGTISRLSHVPGFLEAVAEIAALYDVVPEKAAAMAAQAGGEPRICGSLGEILAMDLDAVAVATPNSLHCAQTVAALKRGLHVLCEKPIAGTLADATLMVSAARRAGRVLHINQSFHYIPTYVAIAELISRGAIGEVIHLRCLRAGGETPDKGWSPGSTWFVQKAYQGGIVLDIGVHMADLLRWYGGEVESVQAHVATRTPGIDVPDNVSALLQFRNGATGILELSWTTPSGGWFLEVYGTEGAIRFGFSGNAIELMQKKDGRWETLHPDVKTEVRSSHQAFLDAIAGVAPSPTSGILGRNALALCDAIMRAGERGKVQKVKRYEAVAS